MKDLFDRSLRHQGVVRAMHHQVMNNNDLPQKIQVDVLAIIPVEVGIILVVLGEGRANASTGSKLGLQVGNVVCTAKPIDTWPNCQNEEIAKANDASNLS